MSKEWCEHENPASHIFLNTVYKRNKISYGKERFPKYIFSQQFQYQISAFFCLFSSMVFKLFLQKFGAPGLLYPYESGFILGEMLPLEAVIAEPLTEIIGIITPTSMPYDCQLVFVFINPGVPGFSKSTPLNIDFDAGPYSRCSLDYFCQSYFTTHKQVKRKAFQSLLLTRTPFSQFCHNPISPAVLQPFR